jgi:hypothetical protein
MNIDILLRGDTRNFLPKTIINFQKMILTPLQMDGHSLRLFYVVWSDENSKEDEILKKLSPTDFIILDKKTQYDTPGFAQWDVFCMGLDMITHHQSQDYSSELTLVLRFDTLWKQPITNWLRPNDAWDVMVPWREYESWWNHHNRISDTFHVVRTDKIELLKNAIHSDFEHDVVRKLMSEWDIPCFLNKYDWNYKKLSYISGMHDVNTLRGIPFMSYWLSYIGHHLYRPMVREGLNVTFATNGFYDSNTYNTIGPREQPTITNNPLYILVKPDVDNCIYYHDDVNISDLVRYDS